LQICEEAWKVGKKDSSALAVTGEGISPRCCSHVEKGENELVDGLDEFVGGSSGAGIVLRCMADYSCVSIGFGLWFKIMGMFLDHLEL